MSPPDNQRPLEQGITTDLRDRLSYSGYLQLPTLLSAQVPLTDPPYHDEMLFIVQHQVAELWLKLAIHELRAAISCLQRDDLDPIGKIFSRIKRVEQQLISMWSVLETLTPSDYLAFRDVLGPASGFQSLQYRTVEFLLGNKNADMVRVFGHDPDGQAVLRDVLEAPSLYDEFLRHLARRGFAVPAACLDRDWTKPHTRTPGLLPVFKAIYEDTRTHWRAYQLCEDLVDIETNIQIWRFRHMKTVERIIGHRRGTGGSSGVGFLKQALELSFFPELIDVRTELGS